MIRMLALLVGGAAILLTSGCAGQSSTQVSATLGAKSLPTIKPPAIVPGPLNGLPTSRSLAIRRPIGVIFDNLSPDSRPQAGLGAASTVIETLAEGGATRFLAIYLEGDAAKIGPVRSTRMYFNHWAAGFHLVLSHVGGNDDAQTELWHHLPQVFNIDENRWEISLAQTGTPLFWRAPDRDPPHNLYTSTYKLRSYATRNHQNWAYSGAYLLHKHPLRVGQRGRVRSISIGFQNPLGPQQVPDYSVQYVYDGASSTYLRFMGGKPHVDVATGKALRPANVIVMRTGAAVSDPNAGDTVQSILIPTLGTGQAYFFRDGTVQQGVWRQSSPSTRLQFMDRSGKEVAFNPGQTWIEVVPPLSPWSYR